MRYRDFSFLVGESLTLHEQIEKRCEESYVKPERIVMLADYPKTILIRKDYKFGSYRRMVTKAAMYCGDVHLSWKNVALKGREVRYHAKSV